MIRVATAERIRATADVAARAGAPQTPLFRAAAEGRIALVYAHDHQAILPIATMQRERRPTILVIGDDPPARLSEAVGPGAWSGTRKLRYWGPRLAIIHGTGGVPSQYQAAVRYAEEVGRLLLVETSSSFARAWRDWIAPFCPDGLMLLPNDGGSHLVTEAVH